MIFAAENHPKLIPIIMKFRTKSTPFDKNYLYTPATIKNVSASTWWRNVYLSGSVKNDIDQDTFNLIISLLTAVASSASVERMFSTFGFVHSDVRNRLGIEKAGKLVFLFRTLNNK